MKTLIAIALTAAFAAPVFAQTPAPATAAPAATTATPKIDAREAKQQERIAAGVQNGSLTKAETKTLEKREAKIEADKQAAKADGKVTPQEKGKLEHELNKTSKKIAEKKHNEKTAG